MSSRRNSITSNISISTQNSSNLIRSTSVDQLMGLDEKFSKRVMKKTPTQMTNSKPSSVNAVNSVGSNSGSPPKSGGGAGGFHKQLGIYYFPNGEVFRPRNAKKKSDDNSPVVCSSPAALSVSASASSSSSFSGHNYQNNSKEELSADLPRSLSFSSIPAHHTFLTKSNSINNMKKINLVQSLRANTNDTPTNIQVASIDRPSPRRPRAMG